MTTYVPKGANRASAARRKAKHDQRNPVSKAESARVLAKEAQVASAKKSATRKPVAEKSDGPAKLKEMMNPPAKAAAKPESEYHSKVSAFLAESQRLGWDTRSWKEQDGTEHVETKRGDEVIHIWWLNGVYQRWASHTIGSKTSRVPNAKSALRVMGVSEAAAKAAAAKKVGRRTATPKGSATGAADGRTEVRFEDLPRSIPWDGENSNEEIKEMLEGHTITFVSRQTGKEESAAIPKGSVHTKVEDSKSGKSITFVGNAGPFRTIALDRVVSVS